MDSNISNTPFCDGSLTENPHDNENCKINLHKRWKYISTDVGNTISLHDCIINSWEHDNGDIILIFKDGFDVGANNSQNNTGRFLNTGSAEVRLTSASFAGASTSKREYFNNDGIMLNSKPAEKLDINYKDYQCEVLDWCFDPEKHRFYINGGIYGQLPWINANLEFICLDVIYCWNEYHGDSWIEQVKKSKNIRKLLCRLGFVSHIFTGSINDIPCNRACYVYPGRDTAYCGFENMYDSNGFYIINIAQNLIEAEKMIFIESIRYPESLTAEEFTGEVERWLMKSAGITF